MLVLSRKVGESVIITTDMGETVRVCIEEVRGTRLGRSQVRISFDAPRHIEIMREEVLSIELGGES